MGLFTLTAEVLAFLLFFIIVLFLSSNKDYRSVAQIGSGSLFGITLEYMNVQVMQTYTYSSQFLIQLGSPPNNIPICIGLCWGLIIYACMKVSNKVVGIPEWSRPLMDGLLALTIDLSMDTVAIRLDGGFWTWTGIPMEALPTLTSFFGVNYGNFSGWFFVVLIFSSLLRLEEKGIAKKFNVSQLQSTFYFVIIPFIAYFPLFLSFHVLPIPVYLLFDLVNLYDGQMPQGMLGLAILAYVLTLASIALFVAFFQSKPKFEKDTDLLPTIIFMFFHLSYIGFYFLGGLFTDTPLILPFGGLMFSIDVIIHWMILDKKKLRMLIRL